MGHPVGQKPGHHSSSFDIIKYLQYPLWHPKLTGFYCLFHNCCRIICNNSERKKVKIKYGETRQPSKRDCKKETISQQRRYIFGNFFSSSSSSFIQISHCTNSSISVILQPIDLQNCLYFSCCSTEIT